MQITRMTTISLAGLFLAVGAGAQSNDELIAQALMPLPDDLKADATVYTYDEAGERNVLKQGSNHVECRTLDDNGFNWCYPVTTAARRDYQARLEAKGMSREEVQAALMEAEKAGEVEPWPFGSMIYRTYNDDDRIRLLWVVLLPNAMAEDLGMSIESQRDNSLAGMGRPWMMREGTPGAHLMIPINSTELSNKGGAEMAMNTKAINDRVAHATLPLPEDLRAGAAVIDYDDKGNRMVLREGTNMIECMARDENTGFTRCYHKSLGAEADLRAKLSAQGKSVQEVSAGINAARAAGEIPAAPMGSIAYRLYENDDRLKLLWVLRLPGATAEELGMSLASQRDNSLAGQGLPWMMREGTPSAHLMIPINGTELSNRK